MTPRKEASRPARDRAPQAASYDIVLVGSGASATFTLIHLLDKLDGSGKECRVALIEKHEQFFTGVPYGKRSGANTLILTSLAEFFPPDQQRQFAAWLAEYRPTELARILAAARVRSSQSPGDKVPCGDPTELLPANMAEQDEEAVIAQLGKVCVRRRLVGDFLTHIAKSAVERATARSNTSIDFIRGEVTAVNRHDDGWFTLRCIDHEHNPKDYTGHKVVLCLGSLPNCAIGDSSLDINNPLLLGSLYENDFDSDVARALKLLAEREERSQILLVGTNASAMEVLYTLACPENLDKAPYNITVVSSTGKLPECRTSAVQRETRTPESLLELQSQPSIAAEELYNRAYEELQKGRASGKSLDQYADGIDRGIMACLALMDEGEILRFVSQFGNRLGRYKRKMELEYATAAQRLIESGVASLTQGWVVDLREDETGFKATIKQGDDTIEQRYDLVINCSGLGQVTEASASPLIAQLQNHGLCAARPGGQGLQVDNRFRASDGLYVMGPLLASNIVADQPVWHMEHCGRIVRFSEILASELVELL